MSVCYHIPNIYIYIKKNYNSLIQVSSLMNCLDGKLQNKLRFKSQKKLICTVADNNCASHKTLKIKKMNQ